MMKTDQEILNEGAQTLFAATDVIDAERFLMLVKRHNFDYTAWQRRLWQEAARRILEIA
jgi:hypothetical protein